jgi:tetratricopeptide (TPR) repeat protein
VDISQKAVSYLEKNDFTRALKWLKKVRQLGGEIPENELNLSAAFYGLNMWSDGYKAAKAALRGRPAWGMAYNNVALYTHKQNKPGKETLEMFKKAGDNEFIDGYFNLGIAMLKLAVEHDLNWAEAWEWYEWRFKRANPVKLASVIDGELITSPPEKGTRILVLSEQGIGDTFNFYRYVEWLKKDYDVVFQAFNNLPLELYSGEVVYDTTKAGTLKYIPMVSIPHVFGLGLLDNVNFTPYKWEGGDNIGYVHAGSTAHANDHNRSSKKELFKRFGKHGNLLDLGYYEGKTWHDTCKQLATCKAVVCVDTSVVHLAGVMGVPGVCLLPRWDVDFRWGITGEDSKWYPSIKLARDMDFNRAEEIIRETVR